MRWNCGLRISDFGFWVVDQAIRNPQSEIDNGID